MIKKNIFMLFILQISLFANYCIEVDKFSVSEAQKNTQEIRELLKELPYPSTVVKDGYISVCTGKFKDRASAKSLLPLTKSRYVKATVISSEGAKSFIPVMQIKSAKTDDLHVSQKFRKRDEYYAIEIDKLTPKEYKNRQEYVQNILNHIPFSEVVEYRDFYVLRTGAFKEKESADTICSVIKRIYPDAKIVSYSVDEKKMQSEDTLHVREYEKQSNIVNDSTKDMKEDIDTFNIRTLDGTISRKLISRKKEDESLLSKYNDIQKAVISNKDDSFSGFYLKSNTAWDTLNNETAYDVRLEWDMYDQGYYHSKRIDEQKEIEKKVELYRSLNYIQSLSKDEAFRKMKYYLNSVNSFETIIRLKIQERFLKQLKQKYKARLITQYEYDSMLFRVEKDKESLKYYHNLTLLKIPEKLWQLLNQIEYVHLKDSVKLFAKQKENSVDNELYNSLVKKNLIHKSWSDKLRLNFYVGQRKMYAAQNQSLLGIDAKIPLTSYTQSAELETLQNRILKEQILLKERQDKDNLTEAISLFIYKQTQLKRKKEELKRLAKYLKTVQKIDELGYSELISTRGKSIDDISLQYHDKHLEILLGRFEVYKLLLEILYQTKSSDFSDLLQYALPNYADHRGERISHLME